MVKSIKRRRKITTKIIIQDFKIIHKNLYDYSLVDYKTMHIKVNIKCKKHGIFTQIPNAHKRGKGCPICSLNKHKEKQKDTTKSFINKAKKIHGNTYKYNKTKYGKNAHEKIIITCKIHKDFKISPNSHLSRKSGCKKCAIEKRSEIMRKSNLGSYTKTFWRNKYKGKITRLYIIECFNKNEKFYKVGITGKTVEDRFGKEKLPYKYKIVKEITSDNPDYIYDLEKVLLKNTRQHQYIPKIKFNGYTECRTKIENI